MKKWTGILLSMLVSGSLQAETPTGILFEVTPSVLLPATQVGVSVFYYQAPELACDPQSDEEKPCLGTVDYWETVCFQGEMDQVCPAFERLFKDSSQELLENGAEEDVELLSCSIESGIPLLSLNLWSFHGGPNVLIQNKMIPMCPIFFH